MCTSAWIELSQILAVKPRASATSAPTSGRTPSRARINVRVPRAAAVQAPESRFALKAGDPAGIRLTSAPSSV